MPLFEDNSSTEPGIIRKEFVEARRRTRPPCSTIAAPKGSVIIRDFRLWHASRPNQTDDEPRVMIVTVLSPKWYRSNLEIVLPQSVKEGIDWGSLGPKIKCVEDGYDYLHGAHDHDFVLLP